MCAVSWTMMWPKASVVSSTETPLARYSVRFMFVSSDCVSQILVRRAQSFSSGGFGRLAGGTMPLSKRGIDYSATQSLPPLPISRPSPLAQVPLSDLRLFFLFFHPTPISSSLQFHIFPPSFPH